MDDIEIKIIFLILKKLKMYFNHSYYPVLKMRKCDC